MSIKPSLMNTATESIKVIAVTKAYLDEPISMDLVDARLDEVKKVAEKPKTTEEVHIKVRNVQAGHENLVQIKLSRETDDQPGLGKDMVLFIGNAAIMNSTPGHTEQRDIPVSKPRDKELVLLASTPIEINTTNANYNTRMNIEDNLLSSNNSNTEGSISVKNIADRIIKNGTHTMETNHVPMQIINNQKE